MTEERDPNWFKVGEFLPIETLAESYSGPVVFADETQLIQWFCPSASKREVEHSEHTRGEDGAFLFDNATETHSGDPVIESRPVKAAFWAVARIAD